MKLDSNFFGVKESSRKQVDRSESLVYFYGQCENIELLQISVKLKNIYSPENVLVSFTDNTL